MDPKLYKFNLQKSPVDPRDFMLESIYPESISLPDEYDLRNQMQPVRDQGTQGTCSAQTAAAMKEWQENTDIQFKHYMSPQFIYNLRANQGQEGMTPRETMDILYKTGIVPESNYPYNNHNPITDALKTLAAKYKIQGYAQVNTVDSLQKALFGNGPCYIAFPVYNPERMDFWKQEYAGQQMIGGHAVTVVGYLEDRFIIRNSWSGMWGESGHTYFPFIEWGHQWEVWTTIDADSNPETLKHKVSAYNDNCTEGFFRKLFKKKIRNK